MSRPEREPSFHAGFPVTERDASHLRFVIWAHERFLEAERRLVDELRYAVENRVPLRALAAELGVSHETIRRVAHRGRWSTSGDGRQRRETWLP